MGRVLGVDPGSRVTGYGVVDLQGNRLCLVAHGAIRTRTDDPLPRRLATIYRELCRVIAEYGPGEVGVEGIFQARNAQSSLKLGHARGVALLAVELAGLPMVEYTPMQVKSAVVGYGGADKRQVQEMVRRLLCMDRPAGPDASDALAVAICHAQTARTVERVAARRVVHR